MDPKPEVMEVNLKWEGAIAILTINNVARRNAWSMPVKEGMLRHLRELSVDKRCRGIVVTGAEGVFCAGGDVKAMQANKDAGLLQRRQMHGELNFDIVRLMYSGPRPVVTAVEGVAFGAGFSIAIAGDYTVAASDARFCAAQILRGLCPDLGLYHLLSARCSPGRARELLLSGRVLGAAEAEKHGVAHEVCEPGATLKAAIAVAERFAAVPPLSFALAKSAMTHSFHSLEAAFRAELDYHPVAGLSRDHRESVAAFLEKRKPDYTGE